MRFPVFALTFALLPIGAHAADSDIHKINDSIRIEASQHAGDAETVNGAIHIGSHATVGRASTTNGSIDVGEQAQAQELSTTNGEISLDPGARVNQSITTANGSIHLEHGAHVGGRVTTANGSISLSQAYVGGGLRSACGDITVSANSRVEGGILVENSGGLSHCNDSQPSRIVIGPHAVVHGTLEFQHEVKLMVSDSAQIGAIKGATAVKFSGKQP